MLIALVIFIIVTGSIVGGYYAAVNLPGFLASRKMDQRLREVATPAGDANAGSDDSIVKRTEKGALPVVDRLVAGTNAGTWLTKLIEQSGAKTTPGTIVLTSIMLALGGSFAASFFIHQPLALPLIAIAGGVAPYAFLVHRRSSRLKRFEEQFPEALDLLSRAIKAGHAFQTAMGMVADELPDRCAAHDE